MRLVYFSYRIDFGLSFLREQHADGASNTSNVAFNGGTRHYQAPELFLKAAKFTKKCDLFAAGVIFLEIITLRSPIDLYDEFWPLILGQGLPSGLEEVLTSSLEEDPALRTSFEDIYQKLLPLGETISNFATANKDLKRNFLVRWKKDDESSSASSLAQSAANPTSKTKSGPKSASKGANLGMGEISILK